MERTHRQRWSGETGLVSRLPLDSGGEHETNRAMAKNGYTRRVRGQNRVPYWQLVKWRILIGQQPPSPEVGPISNGCTRSWLLTPPRLPDFNHAYPIMARLLDQQPTHEHAYNLQQPRFASRVTVCTVFYSRRGILGGVALHYVQTPGVLGAPLLC